jgi:glycosyltransferase involved in cell wall biosynthesis
MRGHLSGDALWREYSDADVFALPTRWPEGFPTVLAEAMDAGLPIVTTPIRGAADHLVPGEHALFVEPGDVSRLADALITLLEDPDLRERMGSANQRRLGLFEPSAVAADYLQALESIVGDRRGT